LPEQLEPLRSPAEVGVQLPFDLGPKLRARTGPREFPRFFVPRLAKAVLEREQRPLQFVHHAAHLRDAHVFAKWVRLDIAQGQQNLEVRNVGRGIGLLDFVP
jgi:hypothetical protein